MTQESLRSYNNKGTNCFGLTFWNLFTRTFYPTISCKLVEPLTKIRSFARVAMLIGNKRDFSVGNFLYLQPFRSDFNIERDADGAQC